MTFANPHKVSNTENSSAYSDIRAAVLSKSPVECPGIVTPLKPRVLPSSVMSPAEPLPLRCATFSDQSDFLTEASYPALDISPLKDNLAFSMLSLISPTIEVLNQDVDLHVGSARTHNEVINTPSLRTPFNPSSPSSPDIPLHVDLSAFPIFDAKIGPRIDSASFDRPLYCESRPTLRRRNSLHPSAADKCPELFTSIPNSKAVTPRCSTPCRPLKSVKKNTSYRLSSIQEAPNFPQCQAEDFSRSIQSSRFFACSLKLRKRSTIAVNVDHESFILASTEEFAASEPSPVYDLSNVLHSRPYNSNGRKSKPSRPTLIPGFIQSLPPFKLPSTPLSATPISISPVTPSRRAAPLKSPFLIRKKDESGPKWRTDSGEYFSNTAA
ncbi:hypothetical protein J3R30DRAFT_3480364 [Lentinula aciculospora]|uniref:Uncharacterized protein n=1 Tax=Lentinula aciculospora TaxID=153920 RepID=A0A9W9ABD0_9AGAR|nr:hypothetical protein J3R30DRAFT_3480364 [Lentinula aciculospora]